VFGLEADIQGSTQKDNTCQYICTTAPPAELVTYDQRLPWFGTARGRVGYAVGSSLFYATGGLAYGEVRTNIDYALVGAPTNVEFSHTRTGWTVGAGLESPFELFGLFGKNWTAKTEYLYVDLGSSSDSNMLPGQYWKFETHVQEHIFRTGLNYHINNPVVARY
jgi:outer membrane immunogenic protein